MTREFSLKEYQWYFKIIKEYYGMTDVRIVNGLHHLNEDSDADTTILIKEYVDYDKIKELVDNGKFDTSNRPEIVYSLIWFVANIYYKDNYDRYLTEIEQSDPAIEGYRLQTIRTDVLELYIALEEYKKAYKEAQDDLLNWERMWMLDHKEMAIRKKKELIKEFEDDYGEIYGEDWKERERIYNEMAEKRINKEFSKIMREEEGWKNKDAVFQKSKRIRLKFGNRVPEITNLDRWTIRFFENHLFPRVIPDIQSIEQAKAELKKESGRKPDDPRIRAIVYGTSQFFYDYELISSRTSSDLEQFLQRLLKEMMIRRENGSFATKGQINKHIQNLPNASHAPKFFTLGEVTKPPVSIEQMKLPDIEVEWIFYPPESNKH